ncbi:MAG: TonB-dependent receptor [Burkholderiaceae bacterium]
MKTKLTPIAAAAAVVFAGAATPAFAQSAAAPASAASDVQRVEVTGIRASMQQSLNQKRMAESHVDVITAEDVGKLPDKNVADSLQRVPGVTISSAGANEGGFDESDRVSMRGTNPSLTQTTINGHLIGSGDWFALDQTGSGTVGRSVSYTLLPSEVIGSVVVHKSAQASLVEGGVVGSVDVITRKPLDFKNQFSAMASAGVVYADLPSKTDPQASLLLNFKNEPGTLGILFQGFYEKRHLRRDGIEELGYEQILPGSKIATSNPDLTNVWYPKSIGEAFFEQERKKTGGLIDIEMKPNSSTTLDLNGFYSKLEATNFNRNYMLWGTHFINQGSGTAPNPGYTVHTIDGVSTLTSATFPNDGSTQYGIYDQISRPGEGSSTQFLDFDGGFQLTDKLKLNTKIGTSHGVGRTPTQDVIELNIVNSGGAYQLNGINSAPSFSLPGANNTQPTDATAGGNNSLNWIFGENNVKVTDDEKWQQIDGDYAIDAGPLTDLKFGARASQHKRDALQDVAQGPINPGASNFANWPGSYSNYPSNFGKGLGGSQPGGIWYYSPADLAAYDNAYANRSTSDPKSSRNYPGYQYAVHESTEAGYIQGNWEKDALSGDVGLRLVKTRENILFYTAANGDPNFADTVPGDVDSAWGWWHPVNTVHNYTDLLPSMNVRWDISKTLVGRFAASRTMTRPDYTALAGNVSLSPPGGSGGVGSGTAGNPDLKPITSNNFDASFEWYFADRSLLSASLFYMDLKSYVGLGKTDATYMTIDAQHPNGQLVPYVLTTPINSSGKVKGVELEWQQPVWGGFGVDSNFTYIDASETGGGPLVGASKTTYNLQGYYENDRFSARVAWNHRSSFFSGLDRSTAFYQAGVGNLTASLNFNVTKNVAIHLDARNLNNPKLKYYALNSDQPRSIYENGRQYYLTASYEFK